ncbi:hypothetical protein AB0J01_41410 [Streptomyces sp. NPDC050204]|uniref:hypothetical protein n=1 Tax=Streptomyces sp. NPDC050204 TaxID=3155514 RepID=UPI00341BDA6D
MNSFSQTSRTAAERAALAYQPDIHPAARPLLDAIAMLHDYQPTDTADLAQLLRSIGGDTSGATNAVAEIGDLVKNLVHHQVTTELPDSERVVVDREAVEYGEIVLQGEGEEQMNQVLHALEARTTPTTGVLARAARVLGGGR